MKKQNDYKILLTMVGGFFIIGYFTKYQLLHDILFYTGFAIIIAAFLSEYLASKIVWAWMKFAEGMGYVMSRIILSSIFFLFLTPIALLYRVTGNRNSLQLKKLKDGKSYFTERNHLYTPADLKRPW